MDPHFAESSGNANSISIASAFARGRYQDIVSACLERVAAPPRSVPERVSGSSVKNVEEIASTWDRGTDGPYLLGALAFLGRVDDAVTLFVRDESLYTTEGRVRSHFYLAIGQARISRYADARRTLGANVRELRRLRRHKNGAAARDVASFYVFQGLAFFRYFQCRYELARERARRAWAHALTATYALGQTLAADLEGYCLVKTGAVTAGLERLEQAQRLAQGHEFEAHATSIKASLAMFRAYYYGAETGRNHSEQPPKNPSGHPQSATRRGAIAENFSRAALLLEEARDAILRGRVADAEHILEPAAKMLMQAGHRRHHMLLYLNLAHVALLRGELDKATHLLEQGEALAHAGFDLEYQLQFAGLRHRILGLQDRDSQLLRAHIVRLTRKTGLGTAHNILFRTLGEGAPLTPGEDPVGDLLSSLRHGIDTPYSHVLKVMDAGYLGMLHHCVPNSIGSRVLCFGLAPGRAIVFDRGDVFVSRQRASHATQGLALFLNRGPCDKAALLENLWGYHYSPLRHDPMVYASVNRLRRLLGAYGDWLEISERGYRWSHGVRVRVYEPRGTEIVALASAKKSIANLSTTSQTAAHPSSGADDEPAGPNDTLTGVRLLPPPRDLGRYNHRQLALLSELGSQDFVDTAFLITRFGVSRMSAYRDIEELAASGLLSRVGRGRATKYCRARQKVPPPAN